MPTLGLKGPGLGYHSVLGQAFVAVDLDPFGTIESEESVGNPLVLLANGPDGGFPASQLIIDGVDRSAFFSIEGVGTNFQLNGVAGRMSLSLADSGASFRVHLTPGRQIVHWLRFGQLFFAGYIVERRESFQNSASTNIMYQVLECADWNIRLAERVVQRDYKADDGYGTLSSIVTAIMAEYLTSEGFALSMVGDPGADLGDQITAGRTVLEVFQQLANATGWDFFGDLSKTIYWFDPAVGRSAAPFGIYDNNDLFSSLEVSEMIGKYRNVQYVISTVSPGALRTDTFIVNAAYPIFNLGGTPTPRPGYVNPRILGEDEAVDMVASDGYLVTIFGDWQLGWGWALERPTATTPWRVHWNTALAPQSIGVEISFTYPVPEQEAITIRRENTSEIAARQAAEGGTGIIESVETVDGGSAASLSDYADALLARYGPDGMMQQVDVGADHYSAAHSVYEPGVLVTFGCTRPLVAGTFLVESVSLREEKVRLVRWSAVLQRTGHYGNWISAQAGMQKRLQPVQPRRVEKYAFTLAETVNGQTNPGLLAGDISNATWAVTTSGVFKAVGLHFQDSPPTTSIIIINVLRATAANPTSFVSIFMPSGSRIQYKTSDTTEQVQRQFAGLNLSVAKGDRLRWQCIQGDAAAKDGVLIVEVLV